MLFLFLINDTPRESIFLSFIIAIRSITTESELSFLFSQGDNSDISYRSDSYQTPDNKNRTMSLSPPKSRFKKLINISLLTSSWKRSSMRQMPESQLPSHIVLPPMWKTQGNQFRPHQMDAVIRRTATDNDPDWESLRHCRYLRPGPKKYWGDISYMYSDLS